MVQIGSASPLTLDDCVAEALKRSPSLIEARGWADGAREQVVSSAARWYPNLSLGAGYDRSSSERYFDFFSQRFFQVKSESWSAGISANQMIFGGGERLFQHRAAKARLRAAEQRLAEAEAQARLEAEKAFLAAHEAREELALAKERLEVAQADNQSARLKTGAGLQSQADMDSAQVQVLESRYQLKAAESAQRAAEDGLLILMGREPGSGLDLAGPPAAAAGIRALAWCEEKLSASASHRAKDEDLRASRNSFYSSLSAWLPQVWASGRYSLWTDSLPFEKPTWSMGLSASLPLFDGGTRSSQTRSSRDELEKTRTGKLNQERQARMTLRNAHAAAELSKERVAVDEAQEKASEQQYRLNRLRYSSGLAGEEWNDMLGSLTALLKAQQAWSEARVRVLRVHYDVRRKQAELAALLGISTRELSGGEE